MCDVLQLSRQTARREGAETVFQSTTYHLRRACDASAPKGRGYSTTPRRSGGWLPGQSFEFRNQMLECFEIADCCH